jgi:hypothetical protein
MERGTLSPIMSAMATERRFVSVNMSKLHVGLK